MTNFAQSYVKPIKPLDDNEQSPRKPVFVFGTGMRAMLLLAMYFSCAGFFIMLSSSSKLAWLAAGSDSGYPVFYSWIGNSIFSIFIFAVPALVYANIFPQERFGFFRINKPVAPRILLFGALAMIVLIPGIDQVATWISQAFTNPEWVEMQDNIQKTNKWALQMSGFGDLMFCLFANAMIPAICEELFFRAGIQQILLEHARNIHIPIISTALIFAFVHGDPSGMLLIFLAGLMLGYAFYWTGSLRLNILMHFLFNGVSIVEVYVAQRNVAFAQWEPGILVTLISFALAGGFFYFVWKLSRKVIGSL